MSLAELYDARGLLAVPDEHPLAWLRFRRRCRVGDLGMGRVPGVCSWCENDVAIPAGCRYHADCADQVGFRTSSNVLRRQVWKRDRGICAICEADTKSCSTLVEYRRRTGHYLPWIADHIVPVWSGGGCCGLANLRTLCLACNERETADGARRRALEIRRQRFEAKGGVVLPRQITLAW